MLSSFRSHLTFANVVASLALFVALGGTSVAAVSLKKNSVGTKQIKNSSLTGTDIKNSSLTSSDVKDRSLLAKDFKGGQLPRGATGPQGPAGLQGPQGIQGLQGAAGITGIHRALNTSTAFDSTSPKTASVTCPIGEKVVAPFGLAEGSSGPVPGVFLTSVVVSTDLRTVTVKASEDAAGVSASWFITPQALCGTF